MIHFFSSILETQVDECRSLENICFDDDVSRLQMTNKRVLMLKKEPDFLLMYRVARK